LWNAQVVGLRLAGHTNKISNGVYQQVGEEAGWPYYKNAKGIYLFRRVPANAWYLRSKFTPNEDIRTSSIKAADGPVPVGRKIWKVVDLASNDDAGVPITVAEVKHMDLAAEQQTARTRTDQVAKKKRDAEAKAKVAQKKALAQDLSETLAAAKLSQFEDALRELGCVDAADLNAVDEADLMEMGMKKVVSSVQQ
jgi:hypothetical protein